MPTARADHLTGPWEVNQSVSGGEDFGLVLGLSSEPSSYRGHCSRPIQHKSPGPFIA
jgi:hypothetical protein